MFVVRSTRRPIGQETRRNCIFQALLVVFLFRIYRGRSGVRQV